jgi:hypothetical protein
MNRAWHVLIAKRHELPFNSMNQVSIAVDDVA